MPEIGKDPYRQDFFGIWRLNRFKFWTGPRKTGKRNGKRLNCKDQKVRNPAAEKFLAEKKKA